MKGEYMTSADLPIMLHSEDVAAALDISRQYAQALMREAGFPAARFGRKRIVSRSDLLRWMEQQEIHSDTYGK